MVEVGKGYAAAAFVPVCADGLELGYVDGARVRQRKLSIIP
jgi:hypothetical protein